MPKGIKVPIRTVTRTERPVLPRPLAVTKMQFNKVLSPDNPELCFMTPGRLAIRRACFHVVQDGDLNAHCTIGTLISPNGSDKWERSHSLELQAGYQDLRPEQPIVIPPKSRMKLKLENSEGIAEVWLAIPYEVSHA